jgi:long-subunit fatty acid transport protein
MRSGRGAALLCVALMVPVGAVAWQEAQAARLMAAMNGTADARQEALDGFAEADPARLNDRASAALAQAALIEAGAARGEAQRAMYLARAQAVVAHLRKARPDWGPTLLLAAQMGDLRAFAASYRVAPFMMAAARWRIAFGVEHWADLPPDTRGAVIEEAVWLTTYDGGTRGAVVALMGDTPAGMLYAMRMQSGGRGPN